MPGARRNIKPSRKMDTCKTKFAVVFTTVIAVLCFFRSTAQDGRMGQTGLIKVSKTDDFNVTGNGSDAVWKKASWNPITQHSNKTLINHGWRIPTADKDYEAPIYLTDLKILYSDKGIYCLFRSEDSLTTATLRGDYLNLFNEDVVEAFFWPDPSMPVYFEYELSPLNFELPLLNVNKNGKLMNWQPWRYQGAKKVIHAVHINEANNKRSWTAEFFIPFALIESLANMPPKTGTRWRANFCRIDYDNKKPVYSSWQLLTKNFNDTANFGTLIFE